GHALVDQGAQRLTQNVETSRLAFLLGEFHCQHVDGFHVVQVPSSDERSGRSDGVEATMPAPTDTRCSLLLARKNIAATRTQISSVTSTDSAPSRLYILPSMTTTSSRKFQYSAVLESSESTSHRLPLSRTMRRPSYFTSSIAPFLWRPSCQISNANSPNSCFWLSERRSQPKRSCHHEGTAHV